MTEKTFQTRCGTVHYWVSEPFCPEKPQLVFLPGLTADHRLFEKQTAYFEQKANVFVWDAPAHGASWPFSFDFSLCDKADWLDAILRKEGFENPVLIGQSMGGYVAQTYLERFKNKAAGFVSVDSAPLKREYLTAAELWALKHVGPVYRMYPWKALVKAGSEGCAVSAYGRDLMQKMMRLYDNDKERYVKTAAHGYKMLAEAVELCLPYEIGCPALLICGKKDRAGSCIRYNRAWHEKSGIPIEWIENAGHNSNTDAPEKVNALIEAFVSAL